MLWGNGGWGSPGREGHLQKSHVELLKVQGSWDPNRVCQTELVVLLPEAKSSSN